MHARVLGREVAGAGLYRPHLPLPGAVDDGDDRAGRERLDVHLEPVARGARVAEKEKLSADRVHRDVDAAVVVEVARGQSTAVDAEIRQKIRVDDVVEL